MHEHALGVDSARDGVQVGRRDRATPDDAHAQAVLDDLFQEGSRLGRRAEAARDRAAENLIQEAPGLAREGRPETAGSTRQRSGHKKRREKQDSQQVRRRTEEPEGTEEDDESYYSSYSSYDSLDDKPSGSPESPLKVTA